MITADASTLLSQAPATIYNYLVEAKDSIDNVFGEGYAQKNPELVAAFIKASERDFSTAILVVAIQEAVENIGFGSASMNGKGIVEAATEYIADSHKEGLTAISDSIDLIADALRK